MGDLFIMASDITKGRMICPNDSFSRLVHHYDVYVAV